MIFHLCNVIITEKVEGLFICKEENFVVLQMYMQ